jgi:hypothetical protein
LNILKTLAFYQVLNHSPSSIVLVNPKFLSKPFCSLLRTHLEMVLKVIDQERRVIP